MLRSIGGHVLALIMWGVSSALGGGIVIQTSGALQILAALILPGDPLQEVLTRRQPLAVARFSLVFLAVAWVALTVVLLVRYIREAERPGKLWATFARVSAWQLVWLGIAAVAAFSVL